MALSDPAGILEAAVEQSGSPVCITTAELDFPGPITVYVNEAFTRLTGYTREELVGATPRIHQGPSTDRTELDRLKATLRAGNSFQGSIWNVRKDGAPYQVEWTVTPLRLESEGVDYFFAVQRDMTLRYATPEGVADETRRMNILLHAAGFSGCSPDLSARFADLIDALDYQARERACEAERARDRAETYFEAVPVMLLILDTESRVTAINQRGCELFGLPRESIVGTDWFARFVTGDKAGRVREVAEALHEGREEIAEYVEHTVTTTAGEHRVIAFRSTLLRDVTGQVEGLLAAGSDITEQRRMEADLAYRASHDPLTGIYNRRRMRELVDGEIRRTQRHGTIFSVILFDIDYFKAINDQHGHDVGDSVLAELTAVVERRLREVDSLARWGGEEFLALLPETERASARQVAEALRASTAATDFTTVGCVTISLGVAVATESETVEALLKRADDNVYAAKTGGRNRAV